MKFKSLILLASVFSLGFLSSCDTQDDPEQEFTSTYPISGDWVIDYYVEDAGKLVRVASHTQILAYNTAANNGTEIWIDDHKTWWQYKVKANVNMATLSISGDNLQNVTYNSKVRIKDGKVFPNGTKVNGLPADSIYFKVAFDDDETPYATDYIAAGHRSTGH
ncbi:MAG: lipid-binding protein [Adhaeribacter sp.]